MKLKDSGIDVDSHQRVHIDDMERAGRLLESWAKPKLLAVAHAGASGDSMIWVDPGTTVPASELDTRVELLAEYRKMGYPDPDEVVGFYIVTPEDFVQANSIFSKYGDSDSELYEAHAAVLKFLKAKAVREE